MNHLHHWTQRRNLFDRPWRDGELFQKMLAQHIVPGYFHPPLPPLAPSAGTRFLIPPTSAAVLICFPPITSHRSSFSAFAALPLTSTRSRNREHETVVMANTLINVSNRLPVTVKEDEITRSSGGLVAALEGLPEDQFKTLGSDGPVLHFQSKSGNSKLRDGSPRNTAFRSFSAKKQRPGFTKVSPTPVFGLCCIIYRCFCGMNRFGGSTTRV